MESVRQKKRAYALRLAGLLLILAMLSMFYLEQRGMRLADALVQAVVDRNAAEVRQLLESGANPNAQMVGLGIVPDSASIWERILRMLRLSSRAREIRGRPVLHQAIISGQPGIVKDLLDHGATVNDSAGGFELAIVRAVNTGNSEIIRLLVSAGADLTVKSRNGDSLLMLAAGSGSPETLELLIARGAVVNEQDAARRTPLRIAAERRNRRAIEVLLKSGARVSDIGLAGPIHHQPLGSAPIIGRRPLALPPVEPLTIAARSSSPELIRAAWIAGGSTHKSDHIGAAALMSAIVSGDVPAVRLLLDLGVPIRGAAGRRANPLTSAVGSGNSDMAKLLINRGAPVNELDASGRSPMHAAVLSNNAEPLRLLLRHGADPMIRDPKTGSTALHLALNNSAAEILLGDSRVQVDARDRMGQTPLMTNGHPQVRRLLIERGADVNARDNLGASALLHAVRSRGLETVREMLKRGADPTVADFAGNTPFTEAQRSSFPALRQELENAVGRQGVTAKQRD